MEKLQYRALRLVFNDFDSSYETLLERVNMPTLHISRIRLIAIETFKILHKISPVYLQDLLSFKNSMYSFRYDNLAEVPRVRTTKYGKSSCVTRQLVCGTASRMISALWKILRSSGGLSAHGAALRTNVNVQKLISFIFAFAYISFLPSLLSNSFALLNFILLIIPGCFAFTNFLLFFIFNYLRLL